MKLALVSLLVAPAVAFAPVSHFGARRSALQMATETESETKVRDCFEKEKLVRKAFENMV